ncbi:MAG: universal stress protein [Nitrospinota bacterium]|nr:MAG: universal stress protein [Nitrospinota bacterium]
MVPQSVAAEETENDPVSRKMSEIKTILVPVDFSANTTRVLSYALTLARDLGAMLHVLHVVHDLRAYTGVYITDVPLDTLQKSMEEEARAQMEKLQQRYLSDFPSHVTRVLTGSPFLEIIRYAKEIQADMIVIGAHGAPKPEHALFGSTVDRVVKTAPCPVTVVRGEREA